MDLSDRQLLEQFATRRAELGESAFATLLERHGPMVFGVCRRVLRHHSDAEDAFQATFLVLAHRAQAIRKRESLASWLYGVAYRLAGRLKSQAALRREKEQAWAEASLAQASTAQRLSTDLISAVIWRELRPVLDEELNRLPEKYRAPLVLCYFEGKTHEEAARALGWSKGSMSRRIDKARNLLRARLSRRGVTLSTGLLFGVIGQHVASAAIPAPVAASTVKAALLVTAGRAASAGLISTQVALLTEGVLKAMLVSKLKVAAAALIAVGMLGAGVGVLGQRAGSGNEEVAQAEERNVPAKPQLEKAQPPPEKAGPPVILPVIPPKEADEEIKFPSHVKSRAQAMRWLLDVPTDKLKTGIDPGTPLREALETIGHLHGVHIRADEAAFDAATNQKHVVDKMTVQLFPARGLALRKLLSDMLLRLQGPAEVQATFLVRSDFIEVVPFETATPEALLRSLVNVTFRKEPLENALEQLVDMTGANVLVDPRIKEAGKAPVSAVLQHVPLDTAVKLLADMVELQVIEMDNVLYVTTPQNAERLQKLREKEVERIGPRMPPFSLGGPPGA